MDKLFTAEFYCKKCDYSTQRMQDWKRHQKTIKQQQNTTKNNKNIKIVKTNNFNFDK